jgi:hypothetical protein
MPIASILYVDGAPAWVAIENKDDAPIRGVKSAGAAPWLGLLFRP